MPHIKVDTGKIGGYATELDSARITLYNLKSSLDYVMRSLSGNAKTRVDPKVTQINDELYKEGAMFWK